MLVAAHAHGRLQFFGAHAALADKTSVRSLPRRRCARSNGWSMPRSRSADPSRCCAICRATPTASPSPTAGWSRPTTTASRSNTRTIASTVPTATRRMTLAPHEFIRRFLMHVLPKGFHRIRHYGLLANGNRAANIARARELLACCAAASRARGAQGRSAGRAARAALPLPVLRRPHDHHRGLRTRLRAETSADARSDADQDRHVMTAARIARRNAARLAAAHRPGDDSLVLLRPSLAHRTPPSRPSDAHSARPRSPRSPVPAVILPMRPLDPPSRP